VCNYAVMLRNPPGEDTLYKYVATYDTVVGAEQAIERLGSEYVYEIWQKFVLIDLPNPAIMAS